MTNRAKSEVGWQGSRTQPKAFSDEKNLRRTKGGRGIKKKKKTNPKRKLRAKKSPAQNGKGQKKRTPDARECRD